MAVTDFRLRCGRLREDLDYLDMAAESSSVSLPTVLILHGNGSNKERHLQVLYRFAQIGFRAIAIDLRRHGNRRNAATREHDFMFNAPLTMMEIIQGSVADITFLLNDLEIDAVGVHGVSLGGIVMFECLCVEPRIKAAVSLTGSPNRISLARSLGLKGDEPGLASLLASSPHIHAQRLFPPRALLMLHGALDEVVPPEGVIDLHAELTPHYAEFPERLALQVFPEVAHETTEAMLQRSMAWFEAHRSELL